MKVFRANAIAIGTTIVVGMSVMGAQAQSLTDALISAYRTNPQLEIDRAALRAKDEGVAQAWSGIRPTVSATAGRSATYVVPGPASFISTTDYTTFYTTLSLSANLTLWDGGATRLATEVARLNVDSARQNLVSTEQTVLLNAVSAFMCMRLNQQSLDLALNNKQVLARQVQAAKDRFEVGEVRRTDVSLAEAAYAGAQAAVARARGNLEISRAGYYIAVGKYPDHLLPPPPLPRTPKTLAAAKSIARRTHPSILAAQTVAKAGELNVDRADAAMKPKFSLSGQYSANTGRTSSDNASIRLGASSTLYAGGRLTSAKRQAIALKEQALAALQLTGKSVEQAVTRAWTQIKIARASITANQKQVRAQRSALRGIREEADLGALTTLDILNAEQNLVRAESNLVSAKHDQYVAVYSLLSSMGLLTVKHLRLGIKTYDVDKNYKKVSRAPGPTSRGKLLEKIFTRAGKK